MKVANRLICLTVLSSLWVGLSSNGLPDVKKEYVQFDKNLYVAKYEVRNVEYRAFLNDLKSTKQTDKLARSIYDSTQWVEKIKYSFYEPFTKMYHWHPGFNNYPVVNITKEAAELYCEWLTTKCNNQDKRRYKKVVFRLPSETEWKRFSCPLPGHNLPWYGNFPYEADADLKSKTDNRHKSMSYGLTNIKIKDYITGHSNYAFDGFINTSPVGSFKANRLGLFDVIGNVSEIIQNGDEMGGSWDSFLEECTIDKVQNYQLPDPRVGFRVVMEVVEQ